MAYYSQSALQLTLSDLYRDSSPEPLRIAYEPKPLNDLFSDFHVAFDSDRLCTQPFSLFDDENWVDQEQLYQLMEDDPVERSQVVDDVTPIQSPPSSHDTASSASTPELSSALSSPVLEALSPLTSVDGDDDDTDSVATDSNLPTSSNQSSDYSPSPPTSPVSLSEPRLRATESRRQRVDVDVSFRGSSAPVSPSSSIAPVRRSLRLAETCSNTSSSSSKKRKLYDDSDEEGSTASSDDDEYRPTKSPRYSSSATRRKTTSHDTGGMLRCPKKGCTETFTRSNDLQRHLHTVLHEGEKLTAADVNAIYAQHSDDTRRWCRKCGRILARADARRRHEERPGACTRESEHMKTQMTRPRKRAAERRKTVWAGTKNLRASRKLAWSQ